MVIILANRTAHVTFGFIVGAIYVPIEIIVINQNLGAMYLKETWLFWIIALLLTILGSEGPDFDQLYGFMTHRDVLSHSAIFPGMLFGVCMWWRLTVNHALVSAFIPYFLAYGSHLFLDYFPNINIRDLTNGTLRIGEKKGTFLMHLPFFYKSNDGKERRTLNVKKTETWLVINSFMCTAMGLLLATAKYYAILPPMTF